jgi:hypothetical protein
MGDERGVQRIGEWAGERIDRCRVSFPWARPKFCQNFVGQTKFMQVKPKSRREPK